MRVLPLLQRASVSADVMWASLFGANWRFAIQQTDYLAADRVDSPVLHYWSLGVEEQFYAVWPIVIFLVATLASGITKYLNVKVSIPNSHPRDSRHILNLSLTLVLGILAATSFLVCFNLSTSNQPFAYFGTFSRAWQLALGGLLAIWAHKLMNLNRGTQQALGVIGSVAISCSIYFIHESQVGVTPYPGWQAVAPTIGSIALLAAGCASRPTGLQKFLSLKPLQFLGGISYSWYLVHWPFLILGHVIFQENSILLNLYLVAASLLVAWLLAIFVENPMRFSKLLTVSSVRTIGLGALSLVLILSLGITTIWKTNSVYASTALVKNTDGQFQKLHPNPAEAASDYFSLAKFGCALGLDQVVVNECAFGKIDSDKSIILLGDSHGSAIFPAVEAAAQKQNWKVNVWTKSACPIADVSKWDTARKRIFSECDEFRISIIQRTISRHPNLVILVSAFNPKTILMDRKTGLPIAQSKMRAQMISGLRQSIEQLTNAGLKVVILHEPPYAPFDPPECLVEKKNVADCSFDAPQQSPEIQASRNISNVKVLDLYSAVCPSDRCSPVKKRVIVYRDRTHMTKTYVLTLAPRFTQLLRQYE
jgi:peptidoglycan/LPS O-acetylase OafA/YrhL